MPTALTPGQKKRLELAKYYRNHPPAAIPVDLDESLFSFGPGRQVGKNRRAPKKPSKQSTGYTPEELHWRESVLKRDEYKCVWCGRTDKLEADHIKPKFLYPDLKYEIDNGRTLCKPCHQTTETYGSKVKRLVKVDIAQQ